ncbi:Peptidase C45, acyl-coenzyme A:6-aminopenicillanic acid acyl-transferase [Penicillium griseofulvum]|uniref:Peptidase C45, acyl-coenzyme A:6-aminopenicillanic acid acyl-transferase n=1 Tax=Penicillium patulum TaxID=5078 RepID=A0A135LDG2_PENPA|nr:Peptidase C45, acyl-coenzyme A:6-aminopenicillanic acid acyl-transferase [Penicillium griseofulvum]KXG46920.1 Peptidase C45, acyl-coenzyme A:6-aminopenicillanic acid acyl-transferase [Penicillium griseofulvum]
MSSENDPIKLKLQGTPREIGLQHGRALREQIHSQISIYDTMFQHTSNLAWADVREVATEFQPTLQSLTPHLLTEMEGIAEGAGLDILDIIALNCRSEIALGRFSDGCTSLCWKKSETTRVLSQNWDWTATVKKNLAMVSIEQVGKPTIYMVTEAGIVGKIGFNTNGVGTCLNAIRAKPMTSSKVPIHVALRLCLESTSVENAVKTLESLGGVASAQHILCADSTKALGLELSPVGDKHISEDASGIIGHTNHFIENRYVNEPPWLSGSPIRLKRLGELTQELIQGGVQGDAITPTLLRERVFSDTYNQPQSICCQEDPSRHISNRSSTLFNIVMNLDPKNLGAEVVFGRVGSGEEGIDTMSKCISHGTYAEERQFLMTTLYTHIPMLRDAADGGVTMVINSLKYLVSRIAGLRLAGQACFKGDRSRWTAKCEKLTGQLTCFIDTLEEDHSNAPRVANDIENMMLFLVFCFPKDPEGKARRERSAAPSPEPRG